MNNLLKQKDIEAAQNLCRKINANKALFLELWDAILDLTTLIPVCIAEYGNDDFAAFSINELIMDEMNSILTDYGFIITRQ